PTGRLRSRKRSSAATGSSRCAHAKRPSNGQSGRPCPTTRGSKSVRFTRCLTFRKTCGRRRKGSSNCPGNRIRMSDAHKAIAAVWKIESTRHAPAIPRVTHDIGIAEELAQDALVTALDVWPEEAVPDNPGAGLMTAAKPGAIDLCR